MESSCLQTLTTPPQMHTFTRMLQGASVVGHGQADTGFSISGQTNSRLAQYIAVKELVPIVMACIVWGKILRQQNVLAHCDNQAVVEVINTGSCKNPELMHLLRSSL